MKKCIVCGKDVKVGKLYCSGDCHNKLARLRLKNGYFKRIGGN